MAGALAGVLTPLAAQASLTISLQLAQGAAGATQTVKYLTPVNTGADVPIYVYATVTGATSVTSGTNFQGFQYAYYNINFANVQAAINNTLDTGTTAFSNVNTAFNFAANGSYVGSTANTGSGILAGSLTVLSDIAHARATNTPAWNNATPGPNNIYVSPDGKSVSFLVETLQVKAGAFTPSTLAANGQNYTKFTVTAPNVTGTIGGSEYASANWNEDSTSTISNGSTGSIKDTGTGSYGASSSGVFFEDTIKGDTDGNGTDNILDVNTVINNYKTTQTWAGGNFETPGSAVVNILDVNDVINNYKQNLATIPPTVLNSLLSIAQGANDQALAAEVQGALASVPEPTSLGLLGLAAVGILGRRKRIAK